MGERVRRIEAFLAGPVESALFDDDDAIGAGRVRAELESKGRPIGAYDVLGGVCYSVAAPADHLRTSGSSLASHVMTRRLPLWLKVLCSVWVALLLPTYWQSTPLGLLWSCNVALLLTCVALWLESGLLTSVAALGIVWWQLLWVLDFLIHGATGISTMGMSNYMFDSRLSLFSRGLSLYHGWLPFVLLWALSRLRYDPRALLLQTLVAWTVFLLSAILTTDLAGPAGNLNMIYGLSETTPQTWMAPNLWLVVVMVLWPASVYVPCHFIFRRAFPLDRPAGL